MYQVEQNNAIATNFLPSTPKANTITRLNLQPKTCQLDVLPLARTNKYDKEFVKYQCIRDWNNFKKMFHQIAESTQYFIVIILCTLVICFLYFTYFSFLLLFVLLLSYNYYLLITIIIYSLIYLFIHIYHIICLSIFDLYKVNLLSPLPIFFSIIL